MYLFFASIVGMFEFNLLELETDAEKKKFEEDNKAKSVLDKIITTGYKALQLEYFFTAGPDEVKAWTIQVLYLLSFLLFHG